MTDRWRVFVASLLSSDNGAFYDELTRQIGSQTAGVLRSIPPGSAHITHAFLGDVPVPAVGDLTDQLQRLAHCDAIVIRLGPPELRRAGRVPRLILAPVVEGREQVASLAREVVAALQTRVPRLDDKPAKPPHVTLARFGRTATAADAGRVTSRLATWPAPLWRDDRLTQIQLVRSTLTDKGPVYDVVSRTALRSSSDA